MDADTPLSTIHAAAPIRVCDLGGWTDTWFAGQGVVLNIAIRPCVEVQLDVYERAARPERIVLHAENYGERLVVDPERLQHDRHALLRATFAEAALPEHLAVEAWVYSDVPAGASTGTSAAVTVALLAALTRARGQPADPAELARRAHAVETKRLGLQSGIQDQISAASGGICLIEMDSYPHARVTQVSVPDATLWELERRLLLVFLGRTHSSSAVHEQVIARLEHEGPAAPQLEPLRAAARSGHAALLAGDLAAFGDAMAANTAAQAALHPALVSADAARVIELARAHSALGWKVNGAGGEGGSLTLLCGPSSAQRRRLIEAIQRQSALFQVIPTALSRSGVRSWATGGNRLLPQAATSVAPLAQRARGMPEVRSQETEVRSQELGASGIET
jgi:D-glycero-alpha-D-manno-heptose-7-phosphate kinase